MTEEKKPMKITFAPGCFDNFEGTQEELDEMMKEIHQMFESGEFLEKSRVLSIDEMLEGMTEEEAQLLLEELEGNDIDVSDMSVNSNRKLH